MDHALKITLAYQFSSKARGCSAFPTKRDKTWSATQMQVQGTDNRVNRIMASCKATALVSKQQAGMTQTLKQNKSIPRQNKLSKT